MRSCSATKRSCVTQQLSYLRGPAARASVGHAQAARGAGRELAAALYDYWASTLQGLGTEAEEGLPRHAERTETPR